MFGHFKCSFSSYVYFSEEIIFWGKVAKLVILEMYILKNYSNIDYDPSEQILNISKTQWFINNQNLATSIIHVACSLLVSRFNDSCSLKTITDQTLNGYMLRTIKPKKMKKYAQFQSRDTLQHI